jgi:hypothetical protein
VSKYGFEEHEDDELITTELIIKLLMLNSQFLEEINYDA